jgi:acetoin utilization deacetylase AcuC-like enzyme
MVPIYYNSSYVGAAHSFDTTRKSGWIAKSLEDDPIDGIEIHSPKSLSAAQLSIVHDPDYVRAVKSGEPRSLAESQGFPWDPGIWTMVVASTGGAVSAALSALQSRDSAGSLSGGLHHARRDRGSGFCTFNGLALASSAAIEAGAESVLILDLDAHCGGGTHSLIKDNPKIWQVDVSVNGFDNYKPSPRTTLTLVNSANNYLPAIERELSTLERTGPKFDLCIYNAGMDPYEGSDIGALSGITPTILARREMMVFEWCLRRGIPVAFVIAGGYVGDRLSQEELVLLHRFTIESAA